MGEIREFECMEQWSQNRNKMIIVVRPVILIIKNVGFILLATILKAYLCVFRMAHLA